MSSTDLNLASPPKSRLWGLWHLLAGFRLRYAFAILFLAISAITKTATYTFVRYLIDDVIGKNKFDLLPWVALGFVGLALFEGVFSFLSGRLAAYTSESIARRLRDFFYDHIQRLSFTYHDGVKTGELIQRATSDIDAIRRFFAQQAIGTGRIVLLFVVNFIAIAGINRQLAVISVITIPFLLISSVLFFREIAKRYEAYQEQEGHLSALLQENLAGVRVVKAFARQAYEIEKFEDSNQEKFSRGLRLLLGHTLYWPLTDIIAGGQMVGAYYFGARMAMDGTISPGSYLSFAGMVIWIIWPIRNLGRLIIDMSRAMVSYKRVAEILGEERVDVVAGNQPSRPQLQGNIRFEDVSFAYEGEKVPALRHITLDIQPGETIALLGATGSGKSSLVNLLPRFYEPTNGQIWLDDMPISDYPRQFLRQQIGIVEQEPFLFSRTIRENISYGAGRQVTNEEVAEAARTAAIHNTIADFPQGYQTLVGERGVTLSGGQKQRVALARTLLKNPQILILDDATASVDTETEAEIREALKQLLPGRTTFIITHRVQTAMPADRIIVLENGQIVQEGNHQSLMAQDGIYQRIYQMQSAIEDELQAELAILN